jgi:large subunit ribosomal protein L23
MINSYIIITSLLRTEKGTDSLKYNKYHFIVDKRANKVEIKRAVEEIYKVKVQDVNTYITHGKLKRVRTHYGRTSDLKKVIVTLKPGNKIEVT